MNSFICKLPDAQVKCCECNGLVCYFTKSALFTPIGQSCVIWQLGCTDNLFILRNCIDCPIFKFIISLLYVYFTSCYTSNVHRRSRVRGITAHSSLNISSQSCKEFTFFATTSSPSGFTSFFR
jgi:hypothetical protein